MRFLSSIRKKPFSHGLSSAILFPGSVDLALNVDAWSVAGKTLTSPDVASNLFAASLFPYLALLYFLARPATKTPPLANFGFQFLLVFVFATIPAGIIAKTNYHDILANVDFLHGIAESFLTLTNLLIIFGFRATRSPASEKDLRLSSEESSALTVLVALSALTALAGLAGVSGHAEPWNALSIPTWIVHSSSLIEWLAAMKLIWEHADTSLNPRWRGMTWAMIPSHMSGLCACTYHLFYNSPQLLWLVSLQASLTVIGNSAMALAAFRIYNYALEQQQNGQINQSPSVELRGLTTAQEMPEVDGGLSFWTTLGIKSAALAFLAKYSSLYLPFLFIPSGASAEEAASSSSIALSLVLLPTALNILKWKRRSEQVELSGSNLDINLS